MDIRQLSHYQEHLIRETTDVVKARRDALRDRLRNDRLKQERMDGVRSRAIARGGGPRGPVLEPSHDYVMSRLGVSERQRKIKVGTAANIEKKKRMARDAESAKFRENLRKERGQQAQNALNYTAQITAQGRAAAEKRMSQPPQKTDLQRRMDARHAETMRRVAATKKEHEQLEQERRDRIKASQAEKMRANAGRRTNNVDRMSVQQGYEDAKKRASVMAGQRKAMAPIHQRQDQASLEAGKITQRQYDNRQLAYQGRHSEIPEPTPAELDKAREQMRNTPEAKAMTLAQRQAAARSERLLAKMKATGDY